MKYADKKGSITQQVMVNGIIVEVERKKIKNMYLKVLPPDGRIHVSAPIRMPGNTIEAFVRSKMDWIQKHRERIEGNTWNSSEEEQELLTGDMLNLWGRSLPLQVEYSFPTNRALLECDRIYLTVKKSKQESNRTERADILNKWYREILSNEIPYLIRKWENIIGVKARDFTIRDMKTRWGTCNIREKRICLNLQLAKKSPECLEYVVVHELVHLLERSHNHVFKAYMDQFLPDWRNIKKCLNGNVG